MLHCKQPPKFLLAYLDSNVSSGLVVRPQQIWKGVRESVRNSASKDTGSAKKSYISSQISLWIKIIIDFIPVPVS